jgi:O-antigen/teichoic acid export membrane protein
MTPLARIANLSVAFLCSNVARGGIALGLALVIGRGLGAERFGTWVLCTAWASTLTVLVDLGFGVLLTRDGARGDCDPASLVGGALTLRLAAALPLALALVIGAGLLSSDREAIVGLRLAALVGAAGAAYGCFGALLRSQPRWLPTVLALETGWLAVQVAASWLLVARGRGVATLVALAAALQLAQIATALALWRPVFGDHTRLKLARLPLGVLLRRAVPFALTGLAANLHGRVAPLLLGALATPIDVGWFGAASRVGRAVKLAPQAIFAGALPVLAHEYGRDRESASRVSSMLVRGLLVLSVSAAAGAFLAARPVMRLVFGDEFAGAAPTLVWTAIGLGPALINSAWKVFLYASGGEAVVVRWSIVALGLQVAAAVVLIPAFGAAGAAVAIAVAEIAILPALRVATLRAAEPGHIVEANRSRFSVLSFRF